jgi:hypothetical protein
MKHFAALTLRVTLPLVLLCLPLSAENKPQAPAATPVRPVLVELFTSEGCSDCPPAEALLLQLEKKQPIAGAEIIPLEEHVDYWNHDGWVDPFSSADMTDRQSVYASEFKTGIYTPEMVVEGASGFVGSNARAAERAIENSAARPQTPITISLGKSGAKDARSFAVSVGKLAGNAPEDTAEVWLGVTEDGLHSSVSAGENAGHVLYHAAVLRYLHKLGNAQANSAAVDSFEADPIVKFNSRWNAANLRVVVFVQEKRSHAILGAASLRVAP